MGVGRLFAVAENYPDYLKSAGNFLECSAGSRRWRSRSRTAGKFYNDAVNINNTRMEQVPDRLLAGFAGLRSRPLFEVSEQERADDCRRKAAERDCRLIDRWPPCPSRR